MVADHLGERGFVLLQQRQPVRQVDPARPDQRVAADGDSVVVEEVQALLEFLGVLPAVAPLHGAFEDRLVEEPGELFAVSFRVRTLPVEHVEVDAAAEGEIVTLERNFDRNSGERFPVRSGQRQLEIAFAQLLDPFGGGFAPGGVRLPSGIGPLRQIQLAAGDVGTVIDRPQSGDFDDLLPVAEVDAELRLPAFVGVLPGGPPARHVLPGDPVVLPLRRQDHGAEGELAVRFDVAFEEAFDFSDAGNFARPEFENSDVSELKPAARRCPEPEIPGVLARTRDRDPQTLLERLAADRNGLHGYGVTFADVGARHFRDERSFFRGGSGERSRRQQCCQPSTADCFHIFPLFG